MYLSRFEPSPCQNSAVKCTVATRHSELDLASLVARHLDKVVNASMTCPHISAGYEPGLARQHSIAMTSSYIVPWGIAIARPKAAVCSIQYNLLAVSIALSKIIIQAQKTDSPTIRGGRPFGLILTTRRRAAIPKPLDQMSLSDQSNHTPAWAPECCHFPAQDAPNKANKGE